jgi:hypothetical protein
MDQAQLPSHTHLFTVRLWREDLGAGQREWRGEVHDVVSGERRYFRDWQTLIALLQALLPNPEPEQKGERLMSP